MQKSSLFNVFPRFFGSWSTQTIIDTEMLLHAPKRKALARALGENSLKDLEESVLHIVRRFCSLLEQSIPSKAPGGWSPAKNMAEAISHLSFDIMGIVCFGRSFETMEKEDNRHFQKIVPDGAQCLNTVCLHSSFNVWDGLSNLTIFRLVICSLFCILDSTGSYFISYSWASKSTKIQQGAMHPACTRRNKHEES